MNAPFKPDIEGWRKYWRGIYEIPRAWAMKGENLFHAFEAVAAASDEGSMQFNLRDQALMLAGMSIEVMLKALIVDNPKSRDLVLGLRAPETPACRALKGAFYSHRLRELATHAGVEMSPDQMDILASLTSHVYWRGRYVVPTEAALKDIVPIEDEMGLVGPPHRDVSYEETTAVIRAVIASVKERLGNAADPR